MRSKMRRVRARFRSYHPTADARSTAREAIPQVYRSGVRDPGTGIRTGPVAWRYGSGGVTRLPLRRPGGFFRRRARLGRTFLPFLAFEARPEPRHQINDVGRLRGL